MLIRMPEKTVATKGFDLAYQRWRLARLWDNCFPYLMFACAAVYAFIWHFGYLFMN